MKILYLCFDPSIDLAAETGGAVHVRGMIRAMRELGHEITVLGTCVSRPEWIESQTAARVIPCGITRLNRVLEKTIRKTNNVLHRPLRREFARRVLQRETAHGRTATGPMHH